jgi:deoxyribodipyrimidine photo-lyase
MSVAVVLFSRDLRVHDNPALAAATERFEEVVPLFVLDDRLLGSANRTAFLLEALADLRHALGGKLVVRHGDLVTEILRLGADAVFVAADSSTYARRREQRLREHVELHLTPGPAIVPPGEVHPAGGDHYRVFTPYWRAWVGTSLRALAETPRAFRLPPGVEPGTLPMMSELGHGAGSPARPPGGESAGRLRLSRFVGTNLAAYADRRDQLAPDTTSQLSPYLHFGCVSAVELATRVTGRVGAEAFLRQLCWRDFYLQLLEARPDLPFADYRPRGDQWRKDEEALTVWRDGLTGYPIIDAAMRQLRHEGWMPGRARLLAASFLVKDLRLDWRLGAAHFAELLVDGDVASNSGNWQWVAGTGTDTRPNRIFNPVRQAMRLDPTGDYIRRYVPELASLPAPAIHQPWTLGGQALARLGYPAPLVDHAEARAAFVSSRLGGCMRPGTSPRKMAK